MLSRALRSYLGTNNEKGVNLVLANPLVFKSAGSRNRTTDTRIFSPLLYRLS
jgi:hypothetical protein